MLKKNIFAKKLTKSLICLSLFFILATGFSASAFAQTLNQGYKSDQTLQQGMLVEVSSSDPTKVEPLTQARLSDLKGVVVPKNDSPVVISSEDQTVFVASTGVQDVLVSDENGSIKPGDYLSISSIDGIAMKARSDQALVLGQAQAAFTGKGDSIGSTTRKSDNKQIDLGRIPVNIVITTNPSQKTSKLDAVPKILRDVTSTVAGKPVSNSRIWLASLIFLATSLVTGIMLYGGAKSSLLALGRNPLSKTSIFRGLIQVVMLGLIVFIAGMFGVYLLLKL